MVSWDKSMAAAFKVIGYSILWWVAGIIISLIGMLKSLKGFRNLYCLDFLYHTRKFCMHGFAEEIRLVNLI